MQHSTDKFIPSFNVLAKNMLLLGPFHFLFASVTAGFLFRAIFHQEVDGPLFLRLSVEGQPREPQAT